jgi:hypothetical protein
MDGIKIMAQGIEVTWSNTDGTANAFQRVEAQAEVDVVYYISI